MNSLKFGGNKDQVGPISMKCKLHRTCSPQIYNMYMSKLVTELITSSQVSLAITLLSTKTKDKHLLEVEGT